MTRLFIARQARPDAKPGVNLAQGFPDFPAPDSMKAAACAAIEADINQYAVTWGAPDLRLAIAEKTQRTYNVRPDPNTQITVTCGATEAMIAALMAVVDPGDEVIVFEPFYENYGPDAILSGAVPRYVTLHEPDWSIDEQELEQAFNNRTRAIIINTPNNPTGKVFSRAELEMIAKLCLKWNVTAITDEIYEHMAFDLPHIRMADIDAMAEQTITISGLSKTYSATGWLIAPPKATDAIRKVHDFLTVGAAAPLQQGAAHALRFPDSYYTELNHFYRAKRDMFVQSLQINGFELNAPQGAYYIMAGIEELGWSDDVAFATKLIEEIGVAVVPCSSFYSQRELGKGKVRFCFCKRPETLELAAKLLSGVRNLRP